jgi:hypothetical protein
LGFFDQVLTGWSAEELGQFAHLLERFTSGYEQTHPELIRRVTRDRDASPEFLGQPASIESEEGNTA